MSSAPTTGLASWVINGPLAPIDPGEKEELFLEPAVQAFVYGR